MQSMFLRGDKKPKNSTFMLRDREKQNETGIPLGEIGKSLNFFGSISSNKCAS